MKIYDFVERKTFEIAQLFEIMFGGRKMYMEFMSVLIQQVIIMFLLMLIGVLLFRFKKLTVQGSKELGHVLVYVIMPGVVINAYMTEFSMERLRGLLLSFLFSALALILAMVISAVIFKKHPIENFGTAFSNAGFMGIPIVQAVLGTEAVFYVSAFVALLNLLQWTYGVFVITKDKRQISAKKILTNPILISMVVGIILFLIPVDIPHVISGTTSLIAGMNAPVAMISIGTYLAQTKLSQLFCDKAAWASAFVRLIVIPALTLALLTAVPENYDTLKLAILIVAAAPVGSNVAIFAQIHNKDYTQAVKSICLSTVCSLFSIPLVMWAADLLWRV